MMFGVRRKVVIGPDSWEIRNSIVAVFVLLLGFSPSVLADGDVAAEGRYAEVARRLEPWITAEMETKNLPALSIALVDDQRIVWARGFGFADRDRRVPATADTVYRVGSVSKLFTDMAVM